MTSKFDLQQWGNSLNFHASSETRFLTSLNRFRRYYSDKAASKDYVRAYVLLSLAVANGGDLTELRDALAGAFLTASQVRDVKDVAAKWKKGSPLPI